MGVLAEEAVKVTADTSNFQGQVESGTEGAFKKIGQKAAEFFAGIKVGDFLKSAVEGGAQLEVQQRRIDQIFGESAGVITHFGDTAAKSYGLSALSADKMTASTGQVLESMGLSTKQATGMSLGIVKLSSDLAAFTGGQPDAVFNAIEKGTLGATRGLKQYGINIGAADVANQALASGIVKPIQNTAKLKDAELQMTATEKSVTDAIAKHGKGSIEAAKAEVAHQNAVVALGKAMDGTVPKLTTAQKSLAAYQLILKEGGIASGDYQKHSHDLGEEIQSLDAMWSNMKDKIGVELLPVVTEFGALMLEYVPKALKFTETELGKARDEVMHFYNEWKNNAEVLQVLADLKSFAETALAELESGFHQIVPDAREFFGFLSDHRDDVEAVAAGIAAGAAALLLYETGVIVVTAATKAWAAIQAVLDAVMDASPVGLAVLAIAALAAGIVLLYQRSATARDIINGAWAAIKSGIADALGFITNTVIPDAMAAWNKIGPAITSAFDIAENDLHNAINAIVTIVQTAVSLVEEHWQQVWAIVGPTITASFKIAITALKAAFTIIENTVELFKNIFEGHWGAAWGNVKTIVETAITAAISILKLELTVAINTAEAIAKDIAKGIAAGIKAVIGYLEGLAGDLTSQLRKDISQVAGWVVGEAESIGKNIALGIVHGVEGAAGSVAGAVTGVAKGALKSAGSFLGINSPSLLFAKEIGEPIADGIIKGFVDRVPLMESNMIGSLQKIRDAFVTETTKSAPAVASAFHTWVTQAKAKFDADASTLSADLKSQLQAGEAEIAKLAAKVTPAAAELAANQAREQYAQVVSAADQAKAVLDGLQAKQDATWAKLLADQAANMAQLKATDQDNQDSALLAGNSFNKGAAASKNDPLALGLVAAQQAFNATKVMHDQGLTDDATFLAAANKLDDAKTAASADSNATQLLDQYNTYTAALDAQSASGAAITKQQGDDLTAQKSQQDQFGADKLSAQTANDSAQQALTDANLQILAAKQQAHNVAEAARLDTALKNRFARIEEHLAAVVKATNEHYATLAADATKSGAVIGGNLAQAMRDAIPLVDSAASALAQTVSKYLKTHSPAEEGPMSDLDTWWKNLAPTLVASLDTASVKAALTDAVTPNPPGRAQPAQQGTMRLEESVSKNLNALVQHLKSTSGGAPGGKPGPLEVHLVGGSGTDAAVYRSRR